MKTFKQYLEERNRENKQKKDAWKAQNRMYRVDPADRENVWKQTEYIAGNWGSAPRVGDNANKNVGDQTPAGKVQTVTKPIAFATPERPNALYAFPRKNAEGKITTAMAVTKPGKKGTILTTPEGERQLKQSKPVKVSSASSRGFESDYYLGDDEKVSSGTITDKKTTIVKNPEKFVRSQYNVRSVSKSGEPYTTEKISKIAQRYGRMLRSRGDNKTSISFQDDRESK